MVGWKTELRPLLWKTQFQLSQNSELPIDKDTPQIFKHPNSFTEADGKYSNNSVRNLMFLAETYREKNPQSSDYGSDDIYNDQKLIANNIRMILASIDMLAPSIEVTFVGINNDSDKVVINWVVKGSVAV